MSIVQELKDQAMQQQRIRSCQNMTNGLLVLWLPGTTYVATVVFPPLT